MATNNPSNTGDSARVFTGVATWGGSGAYFDDTTLGSFTVSRAGTGYIKGKPVSWAGAQTVTGLAAGNCYFIYVDATGTIGKTTSRATAFDTGDYINLFECLRDSTTGTNIQTTVKEDHPYDIPYMTSEYLHDTLGCVIENHNNGANITLSGTRKLNIVGADELEDHGLDTTIPDSGGTPVTWHRMYTDAAGKWAHQAAASDTFSGYWNNAGTPELLDGGAGKRYCIYTCYVSKDNKNSATPVYYATLDVASYNTQSAAATAISNGTIGTSRATNELNALELARLGYIIYGISANAIVQVIINKTTTNSSSSTGGTSIASLISAVTTNFDGILSAADTNVQAALETIDDYSKAPFAQADHGTGVSGTTMLTNAVASGGGAGVGVITSTNANAPTFGGYIVMYQGTTKIYVPYFTNLAA
jgi:hypothetical protein